MSDSGQKRIGKLRAVIGDAITFVRSAEINQALSSVTIEDLMAEQIARNGESKKSEERKYDPYGFVAGKPQDASNDFASVSKSSPPGNFVSGTNIDNPTKIDRLMAIKNQIEGTVEAMRSYDPKELADVEDYSDASDTSTKWQVEDEEVVGVIT